MQIPGQRIRDFREASGWSTNELARACNMREAYLIDIEQGNVIKVHTMTYQKIADALGVTLSILNGDEEIPGGMSLEDEIPEGQRFLIKIILRLIITLGVVTTLMLAAFLFGYPLTLLLSLIQP